MSQLDVYLLPALFAVAMSHWQAMFITVCTPRTLFLMNLCHSFENVLLAL